MSKFCICLVIDRESRKKINELLRKGLPFFDFFTGETHNNYFIVGGNPSTYAYIKYELVQYYFS